MTARPEVPRAAAPPGAAAISVAARRATLLRTLALAIACSSVAATGLDAQAFNIDFGTAAGIPSATYGGVARQAGIWQAIDSLPGKPIALIDVAGTATQVSLSYALPFGSSGFEHPQTSGNEEALLDDYLDLHSTPHTFVFSGLAAGAYSIFSYAWAPDLSTVVTAVDVDGSAPQLVGGVWTGSARLGIVYARHDIVVAPGADVGLYTLGLRRGTLNGVQIVPQSTWRNAGGAVAGAAGEAIPSATGTLEPGAPVRLELANAAPSAPVVLIAGTTRVDLPLAGGTLIPLPQLAIGLATDAAGRAILAFAWPAGVSAGAATYWQYWLVDGSAPQGLAATDGAHATAPGR